jgi:hypothetical protein
MWNGGTMLDLDHPSTASIFAASHHLETIQSLGRRMTLANTDMRKSFLTQCRASIHALRWLANEGQLPKEMTESILPGLDNLDRSLESFAAVESSGLATQDCERIVRATLTGRSFWQRLWRSDAPLKYNGQAIRCPVCKLPLRRFSVGPGDDVWCDSCFAPIQDLIDVLDSCDHGFGCESI